MPRGYACIALHRPKDAVNIGGVLRIAGNFRASLVVLGSPRCRVRHSADTMLEYRHTPVLRVEDVFAVIPYDCVPVAVDLLPDAMELARYKHPERAFYIFGPENGTLGEAVTSKCRDKVYVDTKRCMNLAVTTAVVLYDRSTKAALAQSSPSQSDTGGA